MLKSYIYNKIIVMNVYVLKTTLGDKLSTVKACDIIEAQLMFAEIKKLDVTSLLKIFIIEPVK